MSKDFSLTTFNSKGSLQQLEYALQAVKNGQNAIGICHAGGVVLIAEKSLKSAMVDADSIEKIQQVAPHLAATYAGLFGDFRVLMQYLRKKVMAHRLSHEEPLSTASAVKALAELF